MNPLLHYVWATSPKKAIAQAAEYFASLPEPVGVSELVASHTGLTQPGEYRDKAYAVNPSEQQSNPKQGEPSMKRYKVKPEWVGGVSTTKIIQSRDEDGKIKLSFA